VEKGRPVGLVEIHPLNVDTNVDAAGTNAGATPARRPGSGWAACQAMATPGRRAAPERAFRLWSGRCGNPAPGAAIQRDPQQ
jgi:hypothetical protein